MTKDERWRVGRKVPRNLYRGDEPTAMLATEELAREIADGMNALEARDERIRELEQRSIGASRIADKYMDKNQALEQQLKAAQERLAEAEHVLQDALDYGWLRELAKEYFAKHSPEKKS